MDKTTGARGSGGAGNGTGADGGCCAGGDGITCSPGGPIRPQLHDRDPGVDPFTGRQGVPERRPRPRPRSTDPGDLGGVSDTMGRIPGAKSEPDRIRRSVYYSADTITRGSVRDAARLPGITGDAGETGNNTGDGVGRGTCPGEASRGSRGLFDVSAGASAGSGYAPDRDSGIPGNGDSTHTAAGGAVPGCTANSEIRFILGGGTGNNSGSVPDIIEDRTGSGSVLGTIEDSSGSSSDSILSTIEDSTGPGSVLGTIKDSTGSVLRTIEDSTGSVLRTIEDSTGSVLRTIEDTTGSVLRTIEDSTGSDSVLGVIENNPGSGSVLHTFEDSTGPVLSTIKDSSGSVSSTIKDSSGSVLGTIKDSTGSVLSTIKDSTGSVLNTIKDRIGSVLGTIKNSTGSVLNTIKDSSGSVLSTIDDRSGSSTGSILSSIEEHSRNLSPVHHPDSNFGGVLVDAVLVHHGSSCILLENILEDPSEMLDPASGPTPDLSGISKADAGSGSCEENSSTSPARSLGDPLEEAVLTCTDEAPHELWVDAWAFLPCSGPTAITLEESGPPSPITHLGSPRGRGSASAHLEPPPLERWSSSDSWASALSDLIQPGGSGGPELQDVDMLRSSRTHGGPTKDGGAPWEDVGDSKEDGGRNGGNLLIFSGYPATIPPPRHPPHRSDPDHPTRADPDSRQDRASPLRYSDESAAGVGRTRGDPGMLLAPATLGESFPRSKQEHHKPRTSSNHSPGRSIGVGLGHAQSTGESLDRVLPARTSDLTGSPVTHRELKAKLEIPGSEFLPGSHHLLVVSEEERVACITLDLDATLGSVGDVGDQRGRQSHAEMLHRGKAGRAERKENGKAGAPRPGSGTPEGGAATSTETTIVTETVVPRSQAKKKKKKKHGVARSNEAGPPARAGDGAEVQTEPKADTQASPDPDPDPDPVPVQAPDPEPRKEPPCAKPKLAEEPKSSPGPASGAGTRNNDAVKRRRISAERGGAAQVRARPQLPAIFRQRKEEDVVQQRVQAQREAPRVLTEIEAAPVVDAPQNISLCCTFSSISSDCTVTWSKEGTPLSGGENKVGADGRVTLLVMRASSKDLGLYRCTLSAPHSSVSTPEYHLTSEVLMELVIPDREAPGECRKPPDGEEEDISYAPLLFKDDFLSEQYFGERQHTSMVAEREHFGEGMHRRAFRTTVVAGATPSSNPGHTCVLKVHSCIGYGAKDNDEIVQRNYNLAVEECYVQNTAREYIKAYNNVAKSADSFGEVPEIIPIFLVHRPSNAIPYATLEEELMGDFVKYSVRDGKEINLKRRDSEAGQKCCAFQHWVFAQTEGNLLVTDMQGVGMKLTDVGIATCKKGYKGFKGNCSTSFIDQFKALHQCNRFCELLGLASLQPKPRRTAPPKPKPPPGTKKKPFSPTLKGKS